MTEHKCEKCGETFNSAKALEQHDEDYDHSKLEEDGQPLKERIMTSNYTILAIISILLVGLAAGGYYALIPSNTSAGDGHSHSHTAEIGNQAPDASFTTVSGGELQISKYEGEKRMIWLMATWCPSCKKGAQVLQARNSQLKDMKIIALKTKGNAGYSGPSIQQFANQYAPETLNKQNWVWGDASQELTNIYNPRNTPDIIWLVKPNGEIYAKTAAPAARINQITRFAQKNFSNTEKVNLGKEIEIIGRNHRSTGEQVNNYNSNPPTSGPHYPKPAQTGFYSKKLPDERVIHNIEHGQIWISYNNITSETRSQLKQLAQNYPKAVVVTKRPENNAKIAVASWGRLMELNSYDEQKIVKYIKAYINKSPEPFAKLPN
jgi:thiol-disulfide isomerase/thioredoxin